MDLKFRRFYELPLALASGTIVNKIEALAEFDQKSFLLALAQEIHALGKSLDDEFEGVMKRAGFQKLKDSGD